MPQGIGNLRRTKCSILYKKFGIQWNQIKKLLALSVRRNYWECQRRQQVTEFHCRVSTSDYTWPLLQWRSLRLDDLWKSLPALHFYACKIVKVKDTLTNSLEMPESTCHEAKAWNVCWIKVSLNPKGLSRNSFVYRNHAQKSWDRI